MTEVVTDAPAGVRRSAHVFVPTRIETAAASVAARKTKVVPVMTTGTTLKTKGKTRAVAAGAVAGTE